MGGGVIVGRKILSSSQDITPGTGKGMSRPVSRILYSCERRPSICDPRRRGPSYGPFGIRSCSLPVGIGRAALMRRRDQRSSWPCSRWGLPSRPAHAGRWWSLTPPFHPYLFRGGLFSVALSRGSPQVGVAHHRALWSPDFPRISPRPPGRLIRDQYSGIAAAWRRTDEGPQQQPGFQRHPRRRRVCPVRVSTPRIRSGRIILPRMRPAR